MLFVLFLSCSFPTNSVNCKCTWVLLVSANDLLIAHHFHCIFTVVSADSHLIFPFYGPVVTVVTLTLWGVGYLLTSQYASRPLSTFQSCHWSAHAPTQVEVNIVPSAGHEPEPENYRSSCCTQWAIETADQPLVFLCVILTTRTCRGYGN